MKMLSVSLLVIMLTATMAAGESIDPEPGRVGIYFDLAARVMEREASPYDLVPVHVIVTNPEWPICGYEFACAIEGNYTMAAVHLMGQGVVDVGFSPNFTSPNTHCVGLSEPLPASEATLLCTLDIMPLDDAPISFDLIGAVPNSVEGSLTPCVLLDDYTTIVPVDLSVGVMPNVSVSINGLDLVDSDPASWGQVKSLFR